MRVYLQSIVILACVFAFAAPAAAICGDAIIEAGEQCDLGVANCPPNLCCETSCDSNCQLVGRCMDSLACCASDLECAVGEGCCGNGLIEGGEQCDDGNRIEGDCCSSSCQIEPAPCVPLPSQCGELGSVNILPNPSLRRLIMRDSRPIDGQFDLTVRDRFVLPDGLDIDPDSEIVSLIVSENDGLNESRDLYRGVLDPAQCAGTQCFQARGNKLGLDRRWDFRRDSQTLADAPGWEQARLTRNLGIPSQINEGYKLRGAPIGAPELVNGRRRIRLSVVLGDVCVTRLLDCARNNRETRFTCREIHCGDGVLQRGEQCGEPGLSCRGNKVCDSCRCVKPLP